MTVRGQTHGSTSNQVYTGLCVWTYASVIHFQAEALVNS